MNGHCTCGEIQYQITQPPMFVHCCHCTWCQRETGSAFVLNAIVESDAIELSKGTTHMVETPSESGKGQLIHRCPTCQVALWSHYGGGGPAIAFLRVGTLNDPTAVTPDVHIYTSTKQPWVALPDNVPSFEGIYRFKDLWPEESLSRLKAAIAKTA
ncbi:MAG: GFA family protein [Acidobacteria bacterium]|nr:GFA family protein [Acidobacteriota bacterium]